MRSSPCPAASALSKSCSRRSRGPSSGCTPSRAACSTSHGFYDDLLRFLDHAWTEGFIKPETRAIVKSSDDADALLDLLDAAEMPSVPGWITRATS